MYKSTIVQRGAQTMNKSRGVQITLIRGTVSNGFLMTASGSRPVTYADGQVHVHLVGCHDLLSPLHEQISQFADDLTPLETTRS